ADDVGLQSSAVGDVDDLHLLARTQVGDLHQLLVDRDRADVVEVGLRDGGAMDLVLHHRAEHSVLRCRTRWLSVTWPAIRSTSRSAIAVLAMSGHDSTPAAVISATRWCSPPKTPGAARSFATIQSQPLRRRLATARSSTRPVS